MDNILKILKEFGLEIPADKADEFSKRVRENYKPVSEFDKRVSQLETERDDYKTKFEQADKTLKNFDGVDAEALNQEIADYKTKIKEQEETYKKQMEERDFNDALSKEIESYQFTSEAAKESVINKVKAAGLKCVEGKIMGLNDMITAIKEKDAGAFVDEKQQELEGKKAKFTTNTVGKQSTDKKISPAELMKLKNENPDMDISQYI